MYIQGIQGILSAWPLTYNPTLLRHNRLSSFEEYWCKLFLISASFPHRNTGIPCHLSYFSLNSKQKLPSSIHSNCLHSALEICVQPFSVILLSSALIKLNKATYFRDFSNQLYWEICKLGRPPCFDLLFNKSTKVDDLKVIHIGLTKVVAALRSDVIFIYLIQKVQKRSSLRDVHLCWLTQEISLSPIRFLSTSTKQVPNHIMNPFPYLFSSSWWWIIWKSSWGMWAGKRLGYLSAS